MYHLDEIYNYADTTSASDKKYKIILNQTDNFLQEQLLFTVVKKN